MPGKSLNLIINREKESPLVKKLKVIAPVSSIVLLLLFVIIFLLSLFYVNSNIAQFNSVKIQSDQLEKKIANQKNVEGIYTLTASKVNALSTALDNNRNFNKIIEEISRLRSDEIKLNGASVDERGGISFSLEASSSASLDNFINLLLAKEQQKIFSEINAAGIIRDRKGNYSLSINLKGDKSLFK